MKPILDRVDFRPEQTLCAADLEQASRRTFDLIALHAARVHGVWGVAHGYLCGASKREVIVGPGVAYDHCGRPVINTDERYIPVPVVPINGSVYLVDLVARYAPTTTLTESCSYDSMYVEQGQLRWEPAGFAGTDPPPYSPSILLGIDIPITRVSVGYGDLSEKDVDIRSRPVAHALTRPKIVSGRVLQSTGKADGVYADWTMTVDTSAAGFDSNSNPVYHVALDAHPFGATASLGSDFSAGPPPPIQTRLQNWRGPYVSIVSSSATQFTMRVLSSTDGGWARFARPLKNPVPVSWTAIDTSDAGPFAYWTAFKAFNFSVVTK
jgi:hypothetical protein